MNDQQWKNKIFNDNKLEKYVNDCVFTEDNNISKSHNCIILFQEIQNYFYGISLNNSHSDIKMSNRNK